MRAISTSLCLFASAAVLFSLLPNTTFAKNAGEESSITSAIKSDSLTDQQFEKLEKFILPSATEEKWRETNWIPSIQDGRKMAIAQNKPLFLWAMNGDPLGCV